MADKVQWEYRVVSVGNLLGVSEDALEAKLNELGQDGWEVFEVRPLWQGTMRHTLMAKRPLDPAARRRRDWPGTPQ